MENSDGNLELQDIVNQHDIVVFDTSILEATRADYDIEDQYRKGTQTIFEWKSSGLVTVRDVYREAKEKPPSKISLQLLKSIFGRSQRVIDLNPPLPDGLVMRLLEMEKKYIAQEVKKKYPRTDFHLVLLTLWYANKNENVAFLSGDFPLVRFVHDAANDRALLQQCDYPANPVSVYFFSGRDGTFRQYTDKGNGPDAGPQHL